MNAWLIAATVLLTGLVPCLWIAMRGSLRHPLRAIASRVPSLLPSFAMMISLSTPGRSTARTRSTISLIVCSSL